MRQHGLNILFSIFILFFTSAVFAVDFRSNLGLGVATADQELDSEYSFDAPGGSLDVLLSWGALRAGLIYVGTEYAPVAKPEQDMTGIGVVLGFGVSKWADFIFGYGLGSSSRETSSTTEDFYTGGSATFAGVRLHLFNIDKVSVGLTATYMGLSNEGYTQKVNNVNTEVLKDVESSVIVYGLNFNFAPKKSK